MTKTGWHGRRQKLAEHSEPGGVEKKAETTKSLHTVQDDMYRDSILIDKLCNKNEKERQAQLTASWTCSRFSATGTNERRPGHTTLGNGHRLEAEPEITATQGVLLAADGYPAPTSAVPSSHFSCSN